MKMFFLGLAVFIAFPEKTILTGRWQSALSEKGNVTSVVFRTDNTMEGYINKKPFVSGTFSFSQADSIFSFVDNGCDGVRGTYKILFYSNSDSLRFQVISDSCGQRREGMLRLVLGRVK